MTTYRERKEAKAERLQDYAAKRERDAAAVFKANEPHTRDWAFITQPGHIPIRAKIIAQEDRAHESIAKAAEMTGRAAGIEHQLATSIYSDDEDAVERLTERIDGLEAERARVKVYNGLRRKRKSETGEGIDEDAAAAELTDDDKAALLQIIEFQPYACKFGTFPAYHLQNLGGNINRQKQRLEQMKRGAAIIEAGGRGHGRQMESRYAGTCADCDGDIGKGEQIVYYRLTREAIHAACPVAA